MNQRQLMKKKFLKKFMFLMNDYYLIYESSNSNIKVLDIWDNRQNPQNFPIE